MESMPLEDAAELLCMHPNALLASCMQHWNVLSANLQALECLPQPSDHQVRKLECQ